MVINNNPKIDIQSIVNTAIIYYIARKTIANLYQTSDPNEIVRIDTLVTNKLLTNLRKIKEEK